MGKDGEGTIREIGGKGRKEPGMGRRKWEGNEGEGERKRKGREGKKREWAGMGKEERKGRKGKGDGNRREAQNRQEPRFLPNCQVWGLMYPHPWTDPCQI